MLALIVGGDEVSYGRKPPEGETFRKRLLEEVGSALDLSRVHFLGKVPYPTFLKILQVSSVHVYLTVPFVLSWSMLEAMATGCLLVASRTAPVLEVAQDGVNGLLLDAWSPESLAERTVDALADRERYARLRNAARRTVVERFDLRTVCLPQMVALVNALAARKIPALG
jgi:glycosyltransferase involved in cell wall biosynthesis